MPHKIRVQFDNDKVRWIKKLHRLRPLEDFFKQGEGYVLKSANSVESANSDENAHSDPTTATNASMSSEHTQRSLIRTTRAKARQFFQDLQAEDQLIIAIQKRRTQ